MDNADIKGKGLKRLVEGTFTKGRTPAQLRADTLAGRRRRIAWLLADGWTPREIAEHFGWTNATVATLASSDEVKTLVARLQTDAEELIKDKLAYGEGRAAEILLDLAEHAHNETVRLSAVNRLLDMRGIRGKPVERVQTQNTTMSGREAIEVELAKALRDPTVRDWIDRERPDIKQRLLSAPPPKGTPDDPT